MISLETVLLILLIHWFPDFVLQTNYQALNKSSNNKALFMHVLTYSMVTVVLWRIFFNGPLVNILAAFGWIFLLHFITDYFTSRLNTYLYNKKDIHNFFVSVGFDQWLHFTQLFLVFEFYFARYN